MEHIFVDNLIRDLILKTEIVNLNSYLENKEVSLSLFNPYYDFILVRKFIIAKNTNEDTIMIDLKKDQEFNRLLLYAKSRGYYLSRIDKKNSLHIIFKKSFRYRIELFFDLYIC